MVSKSMESFFLEKSIQICLSSDLINKVIVTCDNQEVNKVLDKFQMKDYTFMREMK